MVNHESVVCFGDDSNKVIIAAWPDQSDYDGGSCGADFRMSLVLMRWTGDGASDREWKLVMDSDVREYIETSGQYVLANVLRLSVPAGCYRPLFRVMTPQSALRCELAAGSAPASVTTAGACFQSVQQCRTAAHFLVNKDISAIAQGPLVFAKDAIVSLDGSKGQCLYQEEGAASELPLGGNPYTIEAWVKFICVSPGTWTVAGWGAHQPQGAANYLTLTAAANCSTIKANWGWNPGGATLGFAKILGSANGLGDDTWHHIASTYDGQTVRLYVDFDLVYSKDVQRPAGELDNRDRFCVGSTDTGYGTWGEFPGSIAGVRVHDWAIAPSIEANPTPSG